MLKKLLVVCGLVISCGIAPKAQAAPTETPFDLTTPTGVIFGTLRLPVETQSLVRSSRQYPVVLIIAGSGPTDRNGNGGPQLRGNTYSMLADGLAARGIASVRYDTRGIAASRAAGASEANMRFDLGVNDASLWIEKLRNDNRFKSVIVAADGDGSLAGVMAAREARADGFVSIAGDNSGAEFSRLLRPTRAIADTAAAPDAIAAYINGLALPPHAHGERKSPRTVTSAVIDGVRIAVEYGQLGVRDRQIWGGIVPWNKQWMPGADEATTITTSAPIILGQPGNGLTIPAGDHTLFALPSEDNFLLQVSNEIYHFHTDYHASMDLGRVKMSMTKLDLTVELLRFEIVKTATGGTLKFAWADREYAVPFSKRPN